MRMAETEPETDPDRPSRRDRGRGTPATRAPDRTSEAIPSAVTTERGTTSEVSLPGWLRPTAGAAVVAAAAVVIGQPVTAQETATPLDTPTPPTEESSAEPSGEPDRFNRFASKLSPDEPLYFVIGWRDGTNAKFQLSFKYRFVNPEGDVTQGVPFFSRVYFGYTQTSLWDLESDSKPFFDTSYRPSLFYRHERVHEWGEGAVGGGARSASSTSPTGRAAPTLAASTSCTAGSRARPGARERAPHGRAEAVGLRRHPRRQPRLPDFRGYGELGSR